ncbi:MAG: RpiB/LacA/LacB family sugar-phosphate isomerase, partial [Candidatus Omnitrophica bacterium]|nr:RpiB/LacA/LacB family sugar-phosphate isomerase [Candidatus Omnitrophota bacterium]
SDHGGYELKKKLVGYLKEAKYDVDDLGTHSKESCDYPLIGFDVAKAIGDGRADSGVLICKTGVGMAIIANKVHGVRAAACYDKEMAKSAREHNNCNVIVFAASYSDFEQARGMLKVWLATEPLGDRHERRVKQIKEIESKLKGNNR